MKRRKAPPIDLDKFIEDAKHAVKRAKADVLLARQTARNERRKKSRLLKRASGLTPEDLERMAVLKRCGLWDPALQQPNGWPIEQEAAAPALGTGIQAGEAVQLPHDDKADAAETETQSPSDGHA